MKYLFVVVALSSGLFSQSKIASYGNIHASSTVIYASGLPNVKLDCMPGTRPPTNATGGACTDNTTALNAVLLSDPTCTTSIELIIDGYSLHSGLQFRTCGNIYLHGIGVGSGLVTAPNSDATVISNSGTGLPYIYPQDFGTNPPPAIGNAGNVKISNLYIDGNRSGSGSGYVSPGNGSNGVVSGNLSGTPNSWGYTRSANLWFHGVMLYNMNNIELDHVYLRDIAAYSFICTNCSNITIKNSTLDGKTCDSFHHQDGTHFDGYSSNIIVANNNFINLCDDNAVLNAVEGYDGPILNVTVIGNIFNNAIDCLEGFTGNGFPIDRVIFANNVCNYNSNGHGIKSFVTGFTQSEQWGSLVSQGNIFTGPSPFDLGALAMRDLHILDDVWIPTAAGSLITASSTGTLTNLEVAATIQRTSNLATPLLSVANSFAFGTVRINRFAVQDLTGTSYTAVPQIVSVPSGGTIGNLFFGPNIFVGNVAANVDTFTGITTVSGTLPVLAIVPTIANGSAAGTLPGTPTVTGNNTDQTVTVITGTLTLASGVLATITFNPAYPVAPRSCILQPKNAAASLSANLVFTSAPSTASYTISVGTVAVATSTTMIWGVHCQ